jgi:hypothetical protein
MQRIFWHGFVQPISWSAQTSYQYQPAHEKESHLLKIIRAILLPYYIFSIQDGPKKRHRRIFVTFVRFFKRLAVSKTNFKFLLEWHCQNCTRYFSNSMF